MILSSLEVAEIQRSTDGTRKMRLVTNNPKKIVGLEGYGLSVVEQVSIEVPYNEYNENYLKCKKKKMGHILSVK